MGIQNDLQGIAQRRRQRRLIFYTMITSIVAAVVGTPTAEALSSSPATASELDLQSAAATAPPAIPYCVEQQERRIGRR